MKIKEVQVREISKLRWNGSVKISIGEVKIFQVHKGTNEFWDGRSREIVPAEIQIFQMHQIKQRRIYLTWIWELSSFLLGIKIIWISEIELYHMTGGIVTADSSPSAAVLTSPRREPPVRIVDVCFDGK